MQSYRIKTKEEEEDDDEKNNKWHARSLLSRQTLNLGDVKMKKEKCVYKKNIAANCIIIQLRYALALAGTNGTSIVQSRVKRK